MEQSLSSVVLLLLAAPIVNGATPSATSSSLVSTSFLTTRASTTSTYPSTNGEDHVIVTSVVSGPSGTITETETFVPTTYSQLRNISSKITTNTVLTIKDGTSTKLSTYSYQVGPGGVGWDIPSSRSDAPIPLPPPTFLPGQQSSFHSSSSSTSSTRDTNEISSTSGSDSSRSSTTVFTRSTSSHVSSKGSSSMTSPTSSQTKSISTTGQSTGNTASTSRTSTKLESSTSGGAPSNGTTPTGSTTSKPKTSSGITSSASTSVGTSSSGSTTSNSKSTGASSSRNTATDSKTSGSSASATTTSPAVTSTITQPPTGFSAVTLSGTSLPSNTWITTKDKDDHTTIVPVIVTGGRGIVMWGLPPTPNVQFSFPNLPKFHLPCIKVFGVSVGGCSTEPVSDGPPDDNGDPTDKPTDKPTDQPTDKTSTTKKTTTSTSECSATRTVSNCAVQCAKATTSNSCVSFTTTCSQTQTGCSVTGVTSTVVSSTSACTTCSSCFARQQAGDGAPPFQTPATNPDDDEELKKRGHPRDLEKRGKTSDVQKLGACALVTGAAPKLTRPAWPAITPTMLNAETNGNMNPKYSTISRYDRATGAGPCAVPTTTRLDAAAFIAAPKYTDLSGRVRNNNNDGSLDHAYEKSWVKDFLVDLIGTANGGGKLTCTDANHFFFPKAPAPATCQWNLLQPVWNAIASNNNLDFVAMSQYVNGDGKGLFFANATRPLQKQFVGDPKFAVANTAAWKWPTGKSPTQNSASDTLRAMINSYFEVVLLGSLEMKSDSMLPLMDKTNNRVYDALLTLDSKIASNAAIFPNAGNWQTAFGAGGIAGAYKDYMTKVVLPQITEPPGYLTDLWVNVIKKGIAAAENLPDVKTDSKTNNSPGPHYADWQSFQKFADEVDKLYLKSGNYEWEYTFSFAWDRNNKRQEGSDNSQLSCPSQSNSGSISATSSGTSSEPSKTSASGSKTTSGSSSGGSSTKSSQISSKTQSGASSTASRTGSISSTKASGSQATPTEPTSRSSTSANPSTTKAPQVTAPAVTIGTSTDKVDGCDQGWGTYSIMAKATAPANAASQKFYVPIVDKPLGSDWEIVFLDGFVGDPKKFDKNNLTDPKTIVESWSVGTSAGGDPIAKGKGGKDMQIKWGSPDKSNGTFVELVYIKPNQPLGQQEWGIVLEGGKSACMPDSCSGSPTVVSDDNGKVCKKYPCSTQIICEENGPITPRADCLVVEDGAIVPLWYDVSIAVNSFVTDGGAKLKSEEKGCGAMTAWKKQDINVQSKDGSWTAVEAFTFTLPITIASGCVERAIASAGGPKDLHCINTSSDWVFI